MALSTHGGCGRMLSAIGRWIGNECLQASNHGGGSDVR